MAHVTNISAERPTTGIIASVDGKDCYDVKFSWRFPSSVTNSETTYAHKIVIKSCHLKNGKIVVDLTYTALQSVIGKGCDNETSCFGAVCVDSSFYQFYSYIGSQTTEYGYELWNLFQPDAPTIECSYNEKSKQVDCVVTAADFEDCAPRLNYILTVNERWNADDDYGTDSKTFILMGFDGNGEKTVTQSLPVRAFSKETDYHSFSIIADAQGVANRKSPQANLKSITIEYPKKPQINKFSKTSSGGLIICNTNNYPINATATSQLEINYGTSEKTVDTKGWTSIGSEFTNNGESSVIIDDKDVQNEVSQHVYLRLKVTLFGFVRYSDLFLVPDGNYYWSESGDEDEKTSVIQITNVEPGIDSESLEVTIGYANNPNYNACLLSYSKDKRAWLSTNQPETFEMRDSYWMDATSKSSKHDNTSSITILELEANTTYYLRARRYTTAEDTKNTKWSEMVKCNTSQEELTGLVLSTNDLVAVGKECTFTWDFPDELKQVAWHLIDASTDVEIIGGSGTSTHKDYVFTTSGVISVYVLCFFDDGRSMQSEPVEVTVVDAPVLSFEKLPITPLSTLPQTFTVVTDLNTASIQVKVLSLGITSARPDGDVVQYSGDVIWSTQGIGSVECLIDDGTALWQNGRYQIQAVATANGVKSNVLVANFTIAYEGSIEAPLTKNVEIYAGEETYSTSLIKSIGTASRINKLELYPEDVKFDYYRITADGRAFLIAENVWHFNDDVKSSSSYIIYDYYAPYSTTGKQKYAILAKNSKGQVDFAFYEYENKYDKLRFDWNNTYVELPFNLEFSDETDKQFEQQIYLDGTQRGAWGASVIRKASLKTDTVYIKDEEVQKKIRELARYQGAVFVRTPLGQAYTANVEVDEISKTYDSKVMAVSFTCTEIDITSEFMATIMKD